MEFEKTNQNVTKTKFYVCPKCNNIVQALSDADISCCGEKLLPLEAGEINQTHNLILENVEDEIFITSAHPMTKEHYISFIAYVTGDKMQFIKLYPEGNMEARIKPRGRGYVYFYCNKHGLFKIKI